MTLDLVRIAGPKLHFAIRGFVGLTWIDVPFETATQAHVYAVEHGWTFRDRS